MLSLLHISHYEWVKGHVGVIRGHYLRILNWLFLLKFNAGITKFRQAKVVHSLGPKVT